jgi:hypothetical protein
LTLFFGRFEELFDLRQDVFSNSFEIVRVFDSANLIRDRAANFFTRGDG